MLLKNRRRPYQASSAQALMRQPAKVQTYEIPVRNTEGIGAL